MFGYENAKGILCWSVENILGRSPLHVSCLEITDVNTFDLSKGTKTQLNGLPTAKKIKSINEFNTFLDKVLAMRTQKPTNQNSTSSRSHLIFSMTMEGKTKNPIVFVDLAGFESPNGKENIHETQFINKSLFTLNQLFVNISQHKVSNWTANALTKFLKPILNENCHVQMLYHVRNGSIKSGLEYIKDVVSSRKQLKRKGPNINQQHSKIPMHQPIRN